MLLLVSLPFSLQQSCDSNRGLKVKDRALLGRVIESSQAKDSFSCAERCLDHPRCNSYNYALSGSEQGLCELNSASHGAPLQHKPGFVFVQLVDRQVSETRVGCD